MTHTILEFNTVLILELRDLFNELENKKILKDIQQHIEAGYIKLVVDLSQLKFMNSVGLNFLLILQKNAQAIGGVLAIANASKQVLALLEITKLKSIFKLTASVEEALIELSNNTNP